MQDVRAAIRDVPNFPREGILFKDITPVLQSPVLFARVIDAFISRYRDRNLTAVAAMESRGFIFAAPLARELKLSFVPLRKPGKLPWKKLSESYDLEYGKEILEIHEDAVHPGDRVLLLDDLLATGGTAHASATLVRRLGAQVVEAGFVVELTFLPGREKLGDVDVYSLIQFD